MGAKFGQGRVEEKKKKVFVKCLTPNIFLRSGSRNLNGIFETWSLLGVFSLAWCCCCIDWLLFICCCSCCCCDCEMTGLEVGCEVTTAVEAAGLELVLLLPFWLLTGLLLFRWLLLWWCGFVMLWFGDTEEPGDEVPFWLCCWPLTAWVCWAWPFCCTNCWDSRLWWIWKGKDGNN